MTDLETRVKEVWSLLHSMPEVGFEEFKTAAYLAEQLEKAGYNVKTGIGGTGVTGLLDSGHPGPTICIRADMDALAHSVNGQECAIHSCGHDAHAAMVLTVAEAIVPRSIKNGKVKIFFQPAEEKLFGALRTIEDGVIEDVDILLGIHLRPIQEAKLNQATPALCHGASYIMEAEIQGEASHGARPHLGVNAVDAAAAVVNAINAIHVNPVIPATAKVTKLQAGGAALNAIPDRAYMAFDLRAQSNAVMEELQAKATQAIKGGAATVGACAAIELTGGCPAAEYNDDMIVLAREAIAAVLGEQGVLDPITTPGGEDFHFFVKHKPSLKTGYIGLGADLTPGLHNPAMVFNPAALINGVNILLYMVDKLVGSGAGEIAYTLSAPKSCSNS
ncbi:amidohydrolase [Sporomusa sp.]|uniref:amidohydrolase n=1 Tax=Sporomusa sp. TaxID=2078658 RepID=UPI002CFE014C|nr:amidohydrolase [Sporomusa sp.]HWR45104.1 amidohydrolase [Sporomusa sp.]